MMELTTRRLAQCAACRRQILDRFVMQAAGGLLQWHTDCLRCADCGTILGESTSCFVCRGQLYCRRDFNKAQFHLEDSSKSRVRLSTPSTNCVLTTDSFLSTAMADSFQTLIDDNDEPVDRYDAYNNNFFYHHRHPHEQSAILHNQTTSNSDHNHGPGLDDSDGLMWKNQLLFASPSPTLSFSSSTSAISSSYFRSSSSGVDLTASPNIDGARHRQCDRPAPSAVHRTPLFGVDQSPWTTSTTTTTSTTKLQRHHHKAEVVVANVGKTPRLRTVLNEHHLRVLRSCYAVTPRPDQATKDKLEQMTGLTPRVIRVWFQNKRCKDKKRPHPLLSRR